MQLHLGHSRQADKDRREEKNGNDERSRVQ